MSWTEIAPEGNTFSQVGQENDYVEVGYVVNFYIEKGFTVIGAADNTWSEV